MLTIPKQFFKSACAVALVMSTVLSYAEDLILEDDFCYNHSVDSDHTPGTGTETDGNLPVDWPPDFGFEYEFKYEDAGVNIMFIIDDSSSMYKTDSSGYKHRMEALHEHFGELTQRLLDDGYGVNVGMTFLKGSNGSGRDSNPKWNTRALHGAFIGVPMQRLTATSRTEMLSILNTINDPNGPKKGTSDGTPLGDAFYEAALYIRGEAVDLGRDRGILVN